MKMSGSNSNSSSSSDSSNSNSNSSSSSSNSSSSSSSSSSKEIHGTPCGDCLVCYDELTTDNYCEYTLQEINKKRDKKGDKKGDKKEGDNKEGDKGDKGDTGDTGDTGDRKEGDNNNNRWYPCLFCYSCVQQLQQSQFKRYCDGVSNSTCAKEQRALLLRGPPVNLYDVHAFPAAAGEEIGALWIYKTNTIVSAKLQGSLTGEAREKLWRELKAFLIEGEPTEDRNTTSS